MGEAKQEELGGAGAGERAQFSPTPFSCHGRSVCVAGRAPAAAVGRGRTADPRSRAASCQAETGGALSHGHLLRRAAPERRASSGSSSRAPAALLGAPELNGPAASAAANERASCAPRPPASGQALYAEVAGDPPGAGGAAFSVSSAGAKRRAAPSGAPSPAKAKEGARSGGGGRGGSSGGGSRVTRLQGELRGGARRALRTQPSGAALRPSAALGAAAGWAWRGFSGRGVGSRSRIDLLRKGAGGEGARQGSSVGLRVIAGLSSRREDVSPEAMGRLWGTNAVGGGSHLRQVGCPYIKVLQQGEQWP